MSSLRNDTLVILNEFVRDVVDGVDWRRDGCVLLLLRSFIFLLQAAIRESRLLVLGLSGHALAAAKRFFASA